MNSLTIRHGQFVRGLLLCVFAALSLGFSAISPAKEAAPGLIKGLTKKNGGAGCVACHGAADATMAVTIAGPSYLAPGVAATYTVNNTKSGVADGTRMGVAVAADYGPATTTPLSIQPSQTNLVVDETITNGEVIHSKPVSGSLNTTTNGSASYQFTYTMPAAVALGSTLQLYATSRLSCCSWNHATNFPVTAATLPGAPTIGAATRGVLQAGITFSAPASNGGLPLTYTATCSAPGQTTRSSTGGASPLTVSSLVFNVAYSCTVVASNAMGIGPPSATLANVMAATLPGAPTIGVATPGPQQASVTFAAPANTGGMPLTYTATCSAPSQTTRSITGSASPLVVLSLVTNIAYTCSVVASNAVGAGPASASASVTPTGIFNVTLSAGPNGTINPTGVVQVVSNGSVFFSAQANAGYQLNSVGTCPVNVAVPPYYAGPVNASCTVALTFTPVVSVGFAPAASSTQARAFHTATLLNDGHVLIAGGIVAGSTYLASAEKYDRLSNAWSSAGSMLITRSSHTATLMNDGHVLVVGGNNAGSSALTSVEIYNPASNSWTTAASLLAGRSLHSAVPLPDGSVLVSGGGVSNLTRYDPALNSWSNIATAAVTGTAVLLNSGKVLIIDTASAKLFDPVSNGLSNAGTIPTPRASFTVSLLGDGRVMTVGGRISLSSTNAVDIYSPATNTWSAATPMAASRIAPVALLTNGLVLAVAGSNNNGILNSAEVYDPASNTWTSAGNLTIARSDHIATRLTNGAVLIHGGRTIIDYYSSSELYIGVAATAPGAPINVTALPGNGQVTLSFDPPASNGGAPIASYTATCSSLGRPDAISTAITSPITVTGLVNFVGYGCTIVATNPAGDGAASAPVFVFSVDPPMISSPTTAMGTVGQSFYYVITSPTAATSYAFTGQLPNGVTLNTLTGQISGTPTQPGIFNVSLFATNGAGTGTGTLTITIAGEIIAFNGVVSRKIHGAAGPFDVVINQFTPIDGVIDVEPRAIGTGHLLVFQFDNGIFGTSGFTVQDAGGQDVGTIVNPAIVGHTIELTLTGIPDNKRVKVTLNSINGTTTASASIGFLVGDVNNNRAVNASDVSGVKAHSGQNVDADNFRHDINASGTINASDIAVVKSRVNLQLQ